MKFRQPRKGVLSTYAMLNHIPQHDDCDKANQNEIERFDIV